MAYQATVLNVMIASPSDVAEERKIVRDAIYKWNAIHSKQFGIMLNPVGWETHVAPQMGGRPQEIINKSILSDSDILIGIFWTRLGSPTGEYISGTVEEIAKHCEKNKLASIYISKRAYPENIDLQQLQLLRDQTKIWLNEGLLEFYDDHASFKQKVKDHLSIQIQNNKYPNNLITFDQPITNDDPMLFSLEMKKIILYIGDTRYGEMQFNQDLDANWLCIGEVEIELELGRETSYWEDAIVELQNQGMIRNISDSRSIFKLTSKGWEAFDQLKSQQTENQ